jgi:hypothetical protein
MKPEHAAVCVGTPNPDVTFSGDNQIFADTTNCFSTIAFDANGDLSGYKKAAHGDAASGPFNASSMGSSITITDDTARDLYQGSLGALGLNAGNDTSVEALTNDGAWTPEYTTSPNHAIFESDAQSPGADGRGTAAS